MCDNEERDSEDGIVYIPSGFWGVIGGGDDTDDAWGVYRTREAAVAAREALEGNDWNACAVRLDLDAHHEHEVRMKALGFRL